MIYISRQDVRRWYEANTTQTCIAVLLLGNFIISIYLAEDPHISPELAHQFDIIEMTFTLIYSVELAVNMAAHWCTPFFASAWNWFDLIIVGMSIYDAGYVLSGGSGSGLNVLRLMRILRVVRIFNKLENMRRILKAISSAIGPVSNAFLLFVVLISIYSVMAVNLLGSAKSSDIGQMQSRFSRFSEAFCVLIGIATGDEWTNYILEDDFRTEQGSLDGVVVLFFMSFNALVFILSFNIIVAVLIEGFMSSMMEDQACKRILSETREGHRNSGSLDPLLATLSNFTSPQHLKSQIDLLFDMWDVDGGGAIDCEEIKIGLQKLGYVPAIYISSEDWAIFSQHGIFCDQNDQMDRKRFQMAMRFQIEEYAQRLLANRMLHSVRDESEQAPILFALKMACHEIMTAAQERRKAVALQLDEAEDPEWEAQGKGSETPQEVTQINKTTRLQPPPPAGPTRAAMTSTDAESDMASALRRLQESVDVMHSDIREQRQFLVDTVMSQREIINELASACRVTSNGPNGDVFMSQNNGHGSVLSNGSGLRKEKHNNSYSHDRSIPQPADTARSSRAEEFDDRHVNARIKAYLGDSASSPIKGHVGGHNGTGEEKPQMLGIAKESKAADSPTVDWGMLRRAPIRGETSAQSRFAMTYGLPVTPASPADGIYTRQKLEQQGRQTEEHRREIYREIDREMEKRKQSQEPGPSPPASRLPMPSVDFLEAASTTWKSKPSPHL